MKHVLRGYDRKTDQEVQTLPLSLPVSRLRAIFRPQSDDPDMVDAYPLTKTAVRELQALMSFEPRADLEYFVEAT
jgi:hypothetical protein